jgi:hypothetical protein
VPLTVPNERHSAGARLSVIEEQDFKRRQEFAVKVNTLEVKVRDDAGNMRVIESLPIIPTDVVCYAFDLLRLAMSLKQCPSIERGSVFTI